MCQSIRALGLNASRTLCVTFWHLVEEKTEASSFVALPTVANIFYWSCCGPFWKNFKEDVCLTRDTPLFATGKSLITFQGTCNTCDPVKDEMMAAGQKVFKFTQQIPIEHQKDIPPCPKWFADLVLASTGRGKLWLHILPTCYQHVFTTHSTI